ncbi:NADAR family protein [Nocardia arthritidis]|nr:NADAR family protein [Nocardia arthritidis]
MGRFNRTYRDVDGQRIEGTWRHVFIRNGDTYFLADLKIYADGMIDCWELVNLDEFTAKVRSGWVATSLPEGARVSAHHLASWRLTEPAMWVDEAALIGEVADEIDRLNGRPDSTERCLAAAHAYIADRTEPNRMRVRAAYEAIPEHLRLYALGDMDCKDAPLRALFSDNESDRERAVEYFAAAERITEEWARWTPADGPDEPLAQPITIRGTVYRSGWPSDPGWEVLQNSYPAPIMVDGLTYPSVTHAYWALSIDDDDIRSRISDTENPYEAEKLAQDVPRRPHWPEARHAVMAGLLRAKFQRYPNLAEKLIATGDAKIISNDTLGSKFWATRLAQLLELVRAELVAERAAISVEFE